LLRYPRDAGSTESVAVKESSQGALTLRRQRLISSENQSHREVSMSSHHCHEGHEKHICQIKDDFDKVRKLVKDPLFICKNCGRAAKNEENLCKPTKL
jgi:hypothetical protein